MHLFDFDNNFHTNFEQKIIDKWLTLLIEAMGGGGEVVKKGKE